MYGGLNRAFGTAGRRMNFWWRRKSRDFEEGRTACQKFRIEQKTLQVDLITNGVIILKWRDYNTNESRPPNR